MFAIQIIQLIIPSNLKKAIPGIHSGIVLTVFAMSKSPKFHQITRKYKYRIEKRKDRLTSRSTAAYLFRTGEEVPVCDNSSSTAAGQQQLSSSSSSSSSIAEAAAAVAVAVAAKAA